MEKVKRELRKHFVKTRMNDTELNQLTALHKKSIDKEISSYIRKVLLQRPVIVKYRNETGDDFLKEIISMKKELNAIGNNFNQAVHKLHLLDKIPEFRVWLNQYDRLQKSIASNVEEIKLRMNKMYEQWLQK